jgi:hypothetical protein
MLRKNLIGSNSGNLLFLESAYKILDTHGAHVTPDRFAAHEMNPDEINERFDVYVIPLANAFRKSFEHGLIRLTKVVTRLKIPVVILGAGLQDYLPYKSGTKHEVDPVVKTFVKAVLDRSGSVGVRGEYTQDYLKGLGFADIEVIGCPSMFLHGDQIDIRKKTPTLGRDAKIAINVTQRVSAMGPIIASHLDKYPNLEYVAQDLDTLRLLMWREGSTTQKEPNAMPFHPSHPLFRDDKTLFFMDPWPWIDHLRDVDFVFGNRIHGNIAGLLAGTPSYVLAHDTRTLELSRYFDIPHRAMNDVSPDTDAADLFAEADYGPMMTGHAARFRIFIDYLERHGLHHIFEPGEDTHSFDQRVASIEYPPPVRLRTGSRVMRARRRVQKAARKFVNRNERRVKRWRTRLGMS